MVSTIPYSKYVKGFLYLIIVWIPSSKFSLMVIHKPLGSLDLERLITAAVFKKYCGFFTRADICAIFKCLKDNENSETLQNKVLFFLTKGKLMGHLCV